MPKWEYKVLILKTRSAIPSPNGGSDKPTAKQNEETLNKLGQDGWELVALIKSLQIELEYIAFLKRPIST